LFKLFLFLLKLNELFKDEHALLNPDEFLKFVSKVCKKGSKFEKTVCADENDFLHFLGGKYNNINKVS
jgi:hypothetical protein